MFYVYSILNCSRKLNYHYFVHCILLWSISSDLSIVAMIIKSLYYSHLISSVLSIASSNDYRKLSLVFYHISSKLSSSPW